MSVQSYVPAYPDLQTLSAAFNASGNMTVVTKFRFIKGVQIQPIITNSGITALGAAYDIAVSVAGGTITAQLLNASTQISSSLGVNVWVVGQQ